LIEADLEKSMKAGIKWYRSKNNVILTSGDEEGYLPVKFFKTVILRGRYIIRKGVEVDKESS